MTVSVPPKSFTPKSTRDAASASPLVPHTPSASPSAQHPPSDSPYAPHPPDNPKKFYIEKHVQNCRRMGSAHSPPQPYTFKVVEQKGRSSTSPNDGTTRGPFVQNGYPMSTDEVRSIVNKLTNSRASTAKRRRSPLHSGRVINRDQDCVWHPGHHKVWGNEKVTTTDLDDIVDRVTKPTVASRGGVDLATKKFEYIPLPYHLKTFPKVYGLDTRFMGDQSLKRAQFDAMVDRLTRTTKATKARFAMDPHVWMDVSPWSMRHQDMTATNLTRKMMMAY